MSRSSEKYHYPSCMGLWAVGQGGQRGRKGGQCLAGEDQHCWAASVQSTSQLYSCRPVTLQTASQGTWGSWRGDLPALVSHFPAGQQCKSLNQYFLMLWQEEKFSLGSHQSRGAFSQYCSQDIGKFVLWTCTVMCSLHLNKHCSFLACISSAHWNHIHFLCWLPVL